MQLRIPKGKAINERKVFARGRIEKFSAQSRNRLLHLVNSIDQRAVAVGRLYFVTLTYPGSYPVPTVAKKELWAFMRRLERAYGRMPMIWKMEPQRRGAPHFHLLILAERAGMAGELTDWVAKAWADIVGASGVERANHVRVHLGRAGNDNRPCVEAVIDWQGVARYAGKYLGKTCHAEGWEWPGRWWGCRNKLGWPIELQRMEIPAVVAKEFKRCARRLREHQFTGAVKLVQKIGGKRNVTRLRKGFSKQVIETLRGMADFEVVPVRPKVSKGQGGLRVFMNSDDVRRALAWACQRCGITLEQLEAYGLDVFKAALCEADPCLDVPF